jgi:ATP-dependent DNA helicase RecQ
MPEISEADLTDLLRQRFGHAQFRTGQLRAIKAVLTGRDVLAVLPTGSGKSLVYQVASQVLSGLTVVVSPLLALIKDQLDSLAEIGIRASAISSLQSERVAQSALENALRGTTKLLYVTPERLDNAEFTSQLRGAGVSLFVVDEAHAISEWGHSFRPAYLALPGAIERLQRPPVLALTATATRWVQEDIVEQLHMRDPVLVVSGTDRPNLFFEVVRVEEERRDKPVLQALLQGETPEDIPESLQACMAGSGIIYTATTRAAQETATWLREWGISAKHYHGRLKKSEREQVQAQFMDGEVRVIVATNAFGLGVDKPDVRFVIHRDIPASVEAYYQEAGRAGRDGEPARCVLVYRPGDLGRAAFLAGTGQLTPQDVERAHDALVSLRSATQREFALAAGLGRADVLRLVGLLKASGVVVERRGRISLRVQDFDPMSISLETEERRHAYERSRVEMMRGYAELRECRRRYILNYFGEEMGGERCNWCDVDLAHPDAQPTSVSVAESAYAVDDRVVHAGLGAGVVQRVAADSLTVLFDDTGYRTLGLELVNEQHLLRKINQ